MSCQSTLKAFLLSTSLLGAVPALAQVAPADASSTAGRTSTGSGPSPQMGEIVVTALKRATTVQNTPIAITALSDKSLRNLGASSIKDIVRNVPGFNLIESDSGRVRISIRGIQTAGESTVGLYYGETPLTGPAGTSSDPSGATPNLNLFDVERVEVLRGPQGTLYGSGSMGGTLRVIFKQPVFDKYEGETEFQAEGTHGGGFGYVAKGAVNVPLVEDKLAARLVLYRQQIGGYTDDPVINEKNLNKAILQGGRFLVAFKPTDRLQFNAMALLQTQRFGGTSQWEVAAGPYISEQKVASPEHDKFQLYNLDTKWDVGFATIFMANSYYKWNLDTINDNSDDYASRTASGQYCALYQNTDPESLLQRTSPGAQLPYNASASSHPCTTDAGGLTAAQLAADFQSYGAGVQPVGADQPRYVRNITNELRLSSNGTGRLNYTAGIFREDRKDRVDTLVFAGVPATGRPQQPVRDLGSRYIIDKVKQTAEFGEVSYRVLKPLTFTVGLRHYHYNKVVGGEYLGYNYFNGQTPQAYTAIGATADGFVKKFNMDYKITRDIMFYFTASQGFRPGGANNIPGLPLANATYKPDSLWNYEAGVKTQFFNHRLTFNIDGYRIDWSNLQTSVRSALGNFSYISNIGSARIEGFEIEASAQPFRGLLLNGSLSVINPFLTADQFNEAIAETNSSGRKGDILPLIPRVTANAGAEYDWPVFSDFNGMARLDYSYTGKMTTQINPTNANYRVAGKYSIFNLRVGIQRDDLGLFFYVNNVFDKTGITTYSASTGVPDYVSTTRPRTIGVNLRKSF